LVDEVMKKLVNSLLQQLFGYNPKPTLACPGSRVQLCIHTLKNIRLKCEAAINLPQLVYQGTLTEGESSVQLTSSLR